MFADYGFIDESIVAQQAGLTAPQTYEILKGLSQRRLLHFIPRRNVPTIRYMQRREDQEHIVIPPHVYEERRAQYGERIHAMLHYAKADDQCRSRQLLAYFGEDISHDCGQCDVCLSKPQETEAIRQQILSLLDDHQPHPIGELSSLPYPSRDVSQILTQLTQ